LDLGEWNGKGVMKRARDWKENGRGRKGNGEEGRKGGEWNLGAIWRGE